MELRRNYETLQETFAKEESDKLVSLPQSNDFNGDDGCRQSNDFGKDLCKRDIYARLSRPSCFDGGTKVRSFSFVRYYQYLFA
jgi:hypothetical protein